jgi:hypothetical protein
VPSWRVCAFFIPAARASKCASVAGLASGRGYVQSRIPLETRRRGPDRTEACRSSCHEGPPQPVRDHFRGWLNGQAGARGTDQPSSIGFHCHARVSMRAASGRWCSDTSNEFGECDRQVMAGARRRRRPPRECRRRATAQTAASAWPHRRVVLCSDFSPVALACRSARRMSLSRSEMF